MREHQAAQRSLVESLRSCRGRHGALYTETLDEARMQRSALSEPRGTLRSAHDERDVQLFVRAPSNDETLMLSLNVGLADTKLNRMQKKRVRSNVGQSSAASD